MEMLKLNLEMDYSLIDGCASLVMDQYCKVADISKNILSIDRKNVEANRYLGISLYKMGYVLRGISYIAKAIEYSENKPSELFYDLAEMYNKIGEKQKADEILLEILE